MNYEDVEKYALQRASREALAKGCSHFLIVSKQDDSRICGISSDLNKKLSDESSTSVSGQTNYLDKDRLVEPNVKLVIRCVRKVEGLPAEAIDAQKYLRENFPGLENTTNNGGL